MNPSDTFVIYIQNSHIYHKNTLPHVCFSNKRKTLDVSQGFGSEHTPQLIGSPVQL